MDWLLPVGLIERPEKGILSESKNPCFEGFEGFEGCDVVTDKPPAAPAPALLLLPPPTPPAPPPLPPPPLTGW